MKLNYPNGTYQYILLQRTTYFNNSKLYKFLTYVGASRKIGKYTHKSSVFLKSLIYGSKITDNYTSDMYNEFKSIENFLPKNANSILDIGAGLGGVDIFIYRYFNDEIDVYLLDKSTVDKQVHFGFEQSGSFYNSLPLAKKFLIMNGVSENRIFTQEATDDNKILFGKKIDIILSLISWGFHYPISAYLEEVKKVLSDEGVMILDVRKNSGGIEKLKENFKTVNVISSTKAWDRLFVSHVKPD